MNIKNHNGYAYTAMSKNKCQISSHSVPNFLWKDFSLFIVSKTKAYQPCVCKVWVNLKLVILQFSFPKMYVGVDEILCFLHSYVKLNECHVQYRKSHEIMSLVELF